MKLTKDELLKTIAELFVIEMESVLMVVKEAKKNKDDEQIIMGHSYLMGLQRGRHIIETIMEGV